MSEQTFGREHELKEAGYTPITSADLKPEPQPELSEREAANAIAERHEPETPTLKTEWHGDPDAAFDLDTAHAVRQSSHARSTDLKEPEREQAERDAELRDSIDRARGDKTDSERQAEADAKVIAADRLEGERQELMRQIVERQAAEQTAQQNRALQLQQEEMGARIMGVAAQFSTEFPDIANLPLDKIPAAFAALEARDPARARAFQARWQSAQQLYADAHRVHTARAQHESTQHASYVKAESEAFDRAIAKDPPVRRQAVFAGVTDLLKSSGIDPGAYANAARQGGEMGRLLASNAVQSLLYNAAAAMVDARSRGGEVESLKSKLAKLDVPPVSRPGAASLPGGSRVSGAALQSKLNAALGKASGDAALKTATQLLLARRGGR
ncbi:MAG: hypothetical protein JO254_04725 [Pseudolabrys sp.]|nr:hypothetical protein [Pseudolabrys sp.]